MVSTYSSLILTFIFKQLEQLIEIDCDIKNAFRNQILPIITIQQNLYYIKNDSYTCNQQRSSESSFY